MQPEESSPTCATTGQTKTLSAVSLSAGLSFSPDAALSMSLVPCRKASVTGCTLSNLRAPPGLQQTDNARSQSKRSEHSVGGGRYADGIKAEDFADS